LSRRSEDGRATPARSDEELVEAIRQSDEAAFKALYERYYRRVYNFVYLRLQNHADTEEAVQEAFSAVFQGVDGYRGTSAVVSWIYGIAKNTVNNHIRRTVAHERRIDRAGSALRRHLEWSMAPSPDEQLALQRCAESVRSEFDGMSAWQSEILAMSHLERLSIEETSGRASRTPDAVRSSLCRAKRMVVTAIETGRASNDATPRERSLA